MGRALFSTKYASKVAVRTEPEPACPCEKWSITNPFDPESDEFNCDAQREVFIDTEAYRQELEREASAVRAFVARTAADGGTESPESSESGDSDRGSPMAVGSDDPALLIADALDWDSRWLAATATTDWTARRGISADNEQLPMRVGRPRSTTASSASGPVFLPPSSMRNSATVLEPEIDYSHPSSSPSPPQSPDIPSMSTRRTVNITPISIPTEPSSPSPLSPHSPVTPTDTLYAREMQALLTPSPPPSVTPHVYTWNRRYALGHAPTSPLAAQSTAAATTNAGPLTNPSARMSLARINVAPARVRIQNAV
ncbi:hypothetical protein DXG03_009465 [Asterophora parasitica]|uniref:Uncharacterized protein n=1 Tax=Asterophora parasitica TaxID=117018 RepID=A0A9P7GCH6_9AGAR|nr:hypothetical protein DXG03_009465 [Asterophora parasitica]